MQKQRDDGCSTLARYRDKHYSEGGHAEVNKQYALEDIQQHVVERNDCPSLANCL